MSSPARSTSFSLASPSASSMMKTAITPPAKKRKSPSRRNSQVTEDHKHKLIIEWIHEYALKHGITSVSRATTEIISRGEGNMSEVVEQRNLISAIREILNIPRTALSVNIFLRIAKPLLSLFDKRPRKSIHVKKHFFMTIYMEGGGDTEEIVDLYNEMFHTPAEENAVTQLFHQLKQYERNQEIGSDEDEEIQYHEDDEEMRIPRVSLRRRARPLSLAELRDLIYDFLDDFEAELGSTALDAICKDVENGKYIPFRRKSAVFQGDRRQSNSSSATPGTPHNKTVFTVDNLKKCVADWHNEQGLRGTPQELWDDIVQQKHPDIIDFKVRMGYLGQNRDREDEEQFDDNGSVISTDGLFDLNYRTPQPERPQPPLDAIRGRPASDRPHRKRRRPHRKVSSPFNISSAAASSSRDVSIDNDDDEYNEDDEIDEAEAIEPPRKATRRTSKKIEKKKKTPPKPKPSSSSNAKQDKDYNSDEFIWADLTPTKEKELRKKKKGRPRRMWSEEEIMNLKKGVKRFGKGYWKEISLAYWFNRRTTVDLKDKWRLIENTSYKKGVDPLDGVEV